MNPPLSPSLLEHLSILPDPRMERTRRHKLIDIMALTICGVLAGADTWTEIELFGQTKLEWFKRFLELPNGIPSHDTFGRVFARLDPKAFEAVFQRWVSSVQGLIQGVVAIDGKTLRGARARGAGQGAIHLVSAWAVANHLVLGQLETEAKSNEIKAVPALLKALDIRGCIVTLDALGCQKALAGQIIEQGGDYILALKANQGNLHHEVSALFDIRQGNGFAGHPYSYHEQVNKDHGRIEVRRHWLVEVPGWLASDTAPWAGLKTLAMVQRQRHIGDKVSLQTHYYLSSLPCQAQAFAEAVRAHWDIENGLHWMMDVVFNEDKSRVRKDHSAANLARVRRIAHTLLRQDTTTKAGLKAKRHKAGWDEDYLMNLLIGKKI